MLEEHERPLLRRAGELREPSRQDAVLAYSCSRDSP